MAILDILGVLKFKFNYSTIKWLKTIITINYNKALQSHL